MAKLQDAIKHTVKSAAIHRRRAKPRIRAGLPAGGRFRRADRQRRRQARAGDDRSRPEKAVAFRKSGRRFSFRKCGHSMKARALPDPCNRGASARHRRMNARDRHRRSRRGSGPAHLRPCASPRSGSVGGRTCLPTRSGRSDMISSSPATRVPRTSGGLRGEIRVPRGRELRRDILRPSIEAIINTTPNAAHLETVQLAAAAGKHVFLDKPIANTVADGREIARACEPPRSCLSLGYQRRRERHFRWIRSEIDAGRFGRLVQAEANISRDRLGKIDLRSWRYQAAGMPGGVMLQIGHPLRGRARDAARSGQARVSAMSAQLVLPGDNPDVAAMTLGARERRRLQSHGLLRVGRRILHAQRLREGSTAHSTTCSTACGISSVARRPAAGRGRGQRYDPRGAGGIRALRARRRQARDGRLVGRLAASAVVRAGMKSAREGRAVDVAEIMAGGRIERIAGQFDRRSIGLGWRNSGHAALFISDSPDTPSGLIPMRSRVFPLPRSPRRAIGSPTQAICLIRF